MRRRLLSALCALALLRAQSEAPKDFWTKLHPYFGGEYTSIDIQFLGRSLFTYPADFTGIGLGANYIFYRDADEFFAVGPGAQVTGAFQLGAFGSNWMIQVPVYGFARIGAAATPYNQQRLGGGIALGMRYTAFQVIYTPTTLSGYVGRLKQNFITPTAIVELILNFNRSLPSALRFYMDILPARRNTEIYGSFDPVPLDYRTMGIGVYYYLPH
jgi:hypothetical protein